MGAQRASTPGTSADTADGFGVAVVREEGKWHCSPMAPQALTSLSAAETELRDLRSAGAVLATQTPCSPLANSKKSLQKIIAKTLAVGAG